MQQIVRQLAAEIKVSEQQVRAAVELLDGGATVPFIARYRKEVTGGLDDIQLRELEARLSYLRELEDRRVAVLKAIDEQGKLTDALRAAIAAAPTKQELEDIYLPDGQANAQLLLHALLHPAQVGQAAQVLQPLQHLLFFAAREHQDAHIAAWRLE